MDDSDQNAVYEKIINDIDAVFTKDPDLSTFEIIHLASNQNKNKSPVVHVENNLGLESWCIQHVYEYAHKTILNYKHDHNTKIIQSTAQLLKYLNSALLINPDVATFWNLRRKLFVKNRLNITKEFQFSSIVLSKKPKSNEAFFYRRWLFSFQSGESIDWTFELGLCERCADKSSSNYHAWCHRQWVLQKAPYLLKYESRKSEKFIRKHIADYSGYNHRQHVLTKLLETEFYEIETSNDYTALCDYVSSLNLASLSSSATKEQELLKIILPNFCDSSSSQCVRENAKLKNKIQSLLYCLNLAAYDLHLCKELKSMFGYREAFECHRRAVLKFIVDNVLALDNAASSEPQMKMLKLSENQTTKEPNPFLIAIREAEGQLSDTHRDWCHKFLGFEFATTATSSSSLKK